MIEGDDMIQVFPMGRIRGWVIDVFKVEIHLWSDSVIQEQPMSPDWLLTEQTTKSADGDLCIREN
jgi:hypothetical protein